MTMTFQEATQAYIQHLQNTGKSPRTLYTYGQDLKQILAFWGAEKPLTQVSLPLIGKFLKSPELLLLPDGETRSPRTIQKTLRVFRLFLAFCIEQGWLSPLSLPKAMPLGRSKAFFILC